jgi:hypothetical protein
MFLTIPHPGSLQVIPHRWEVISKWLKTPEIIWFQGFLHFGIAQINSNRVKEEGHIGARSGHMILGF